MASVARLFLALIAASMVLISLSRASDMLLRVKICEDSV